MDDVGGMHAGGPALQEHSASRVQREQQRGANMAEQQKPALTEDMLKVIHGHIDHGEKRDNYQNSLQRWWKDYSHRKNDEEDMVADSLLYDERCHLPRTTPGPKQPEPEVTAAAPPQTPPQEDLQQQEAMQE